VGVVMNDVAVVGCLLSPSMADLTSSERFLVN